MMRRRAVDIDPKEFSRLRDILIKAHAALDEAECVLKAANEAEQSARFAVSKAYDDFRKYVRKCANVELYL